MLHIVIHRHSTCICDPMGICKLIAFLCVFEKDTLLCFSWVAILTSRNISVHNCMAVSNFADWLPLPRRGYKMGQRAHFFIVWWLIQGRKIRSKLIKTLHKLQAYSHSWPICNMLDHQTLFRALPRQLNNP